MKVNRWDFEKHKYDVVNINPDWVVTTKGELDWIVNCVNCGKMLLVENCYTSYQYQDGVGFGYLVCEDCANKEWELRKRYQNGND